MQSFLFCLIFHEVLNPLRRDVIKRLNPRSIIRRRHVDFLVVVFSHVVGTLNSLGQLLLAVLLLYGLVFAACVRILRLHDADLLERLDSLLHLVEGRLGLTAPIVPLYILFVELYSLASIYHHRD